MRWEFAGGMIRVVTRSVVIVDDHDGFRSVARALLESVGYVVLGEADDGESALVEIERCQPDLVLLDIQLPDVDGFEVARDLLALDDPPVIVLISSRQAADFAGRVRMSGVEGFLSKSELSEVTLAAILGEVPS